jgi:ABC-type iron transport system FetAB ATPase subunit
MLRVESMKLLNHKRVNFVVPERAGIVIQGQNGCGKSLLMKSLAKLIPSESKIFMFNGSEVGTLSLENYRSQVLYVPSVPPTMIDVSVEDFFQEAFNLQIYQNHIVTFPYQDYLKQWKLKDEMLQNLSSGQKQMVSILRAITLKAKVLLLDEPTANLDHEKTLKTEKLLYDWMDQTKGSVVIVSHSAEQAKRTGFEIISFERLIAFSKDT